MPRRLSKRANTYEFYKRLINHPAITDLSYLVVGKDRKVYYVDGFVSRSVLRVTNLETLDTTEKEVGFFIGSPALGKFNELSATQDAHQLYSLPFKRNYLHANELSEKSKEIITNIMNNLHITIREKDKPRDFEDALRKSRELKERRKNREIVEKLQDEFGVTLSEEDKNEFLRSKYYDETLRHMYQKILDKEKLGRTKEAGIDYFCDYLQKCAEKTDIDDEVLVTTEELKSLVESN